MKKNRIYLKQSGPEQRIKGRIRTGYYEAGHMIYIHKPSHARKKKQ